MEVDQKEVRSNLYYIKYQILEENNFIVTTAKDSFDAKKKLVGVNTLITNKIVSEALNQQKIKHIKL